MPGPGKRRAALHDRKPTPRNTRVTRALYAARMSSLSSSIDGTDGLDAARSHWHWRGQARPPFAVEPNRHQESVWDYPRPPRLETDPREVVIRWGTLVVARSMRAIRALETAHPPSFYIPLDDIAPGLLQPAEGTSLCEWKGPARYWSLVDGERRLAKVAWSYPRPLAGSEALRDGVAFYCHALECTVGSAIVAPQPGGFYGGWITPELVGPFKGAPGSEGW
jgi:uncharacterized protein (DUF427 family)